MKTFISGVILALLALSLLASAFRVLPVISPAATITVADQTVGVPFAQEFNYPLRSYYPHSSSGDEQIDHGTFASEASTVDYSSSNFPVSISYLPYTSVGVSTEFTVSVPAGPSAISMGVMNGSATIQVSQSGQTLLSQNVTGEPFDYVVVTSSTSYCYVNFDSTGQTVDIVVNELAGQPVVAYNAYDNYISDYTASLITYPPQFALNFSPPTPVNTGLSFLLVAPNYTQPTPLAIWVGEGFSDQTTGNSWWAQIGFNNWADDMNVSYAGWGIFSNIFGNPSGTDTNYPLVPGDTYNFTMALVSGTTWEFVVNDTLIQEPNLSGLFNTTTTICNGGADLGLETLTAWGGNVGITTMIGIPMVLSFRVNGQWSEPSSFQFGSIGENWWNGNATGAPGIDLWGIAGHLQDSSVPVGSLLFNDSLPMPLDVPGTASEPIYGDFSYPQTSSGGGLVTVEKTSDTSLQVSPMSIPSFVSVATYESGDEYMTSLTDAMVSAAKEFTVPEGTSTAVIYAANNSFNETSSYVLDVVSAPVTYDVTISAHCNTEGTDVNVATTEDGASTGFETPHTFIALAGTHTFTVPNNDANGHPFKNWNTGQTATTLTVSSGGTYIAYYGALPPSSYNVALTISNTQPEPVPSPFQEMIAINSSAYARYEASNLQNVEFLYVNGTVIPSWLESGNSNTSTNSVYWLKIDGGIPADSNITIYMVFASPSINLFNNETKGEAPTLSPIYGEYDDGAYVFGFYDNFAGSSLSNQWVVSLGNGSYQVHNGLTINYVNTEYVAGYVASSSSFGPGTVLDADVTSIGDVCNVGYFNLQEPLGTGGYAGAFIRTACGNTYPDQWNSNGEANGCGGMYGSLANAEGIPGIYAIGVLSSTSSIQYLNNMLGISKQPITTNYPSYPASVGFWGGNVNSLGVQWARVRALPPNGVMPSLSAIGHGLETITDVTFAKNVLGQGFLFNVNITAANNENAGAPTETFNVTIYANTTYIASQNVILGSGASATITLTWNTTGFAYGNYTLSAYAWPVPSETNLMGIFIGGQITLTILGDINGDFHVSLADLVLLANAYGSKPGDTKWNANADINGNGVVDLSDLVLLANHYGQKYP